MQPYILGIDIGTGSTKAVAVDFNGVPLAVSQHHYPIKNPQPGYSEQDPRVIFDAFTSCITDVVKKTGISADAISISSAMHSVIPVDSNGNALADMITWADARSEAIAQKLRASPQGETLYKNCGTPIHAMSPLCKIIWIKENQPKLFQTAHKFVSIKEYIWFRLFSEFEIDYAIASSTGMFDIEKLEWNEEAYRLAGITPDKLSKPVNTTYSRDDLNEELTQTLTLKPATHFVIGASDGCCANLGSYINDNIASLTIGTSGAVRITSPKPVYNYSAMIFNYLINKTTFACGGAVNNGGIVLQWLLKSFMDKKLPGHTDYENAFALMGEIPAGSEGLIFLPYLYGERAPLWDTKSCGVFFNIKPQHTNAHFLRAGLEGICFALNDVLNEVEKSSAPIRQVNISGGFITSPFWTQLLADITGKNLAIIQQDDASALGAIFLAMDALGLQKPEQPAFNEAAMIEPSAQNHETYGKGFLLFKRLYNDLKDTMHWVHDQQL